MSDAPKAVFLSYAREDTDAAKRIAEALRGFGVEVWFDQAELHGGDAWDAKIRKQIRECALFVPLVSQQTEERAEGYFRREWKIAIDRTQDMGSSRAFIVPVVIDGTKETGADVPEEFMRYQWTRLPGGAPTPEFVALVKRLLEAPRKPALKPDQPRPPTLPPYLKAGKTVAGLAEAGGPGSTHSANSGQATRATKSAVPGWMWAVLGVVLIGVAVGVVLLRPPAPVAASPSEPKPASAAPVAKPPLDFANAKSIAVLPFANMSADKENEFFADGVHDDVITSLAKIRDLKVISRTSVLAYRDPAARNLKKIAEELGVAVVLEGSVRRAGTKVRVTAQLIDARTDAHLWAETYDGDTGDIFALQAKLAQQIAGALKATLTGSERALIERRPTEDQAAYELFLRGRVLEQALSSTAVREPYDAIISLYEQALGRDPAFALAHVHLSTIHGMMYWFGSVDPTPERRARAQASLAAAQRLAPDAPETRYAQGTFAYLCENDWSKALEEYRAAEAGLPNDARLHYRIGLTLRRLGRAPESVSRFDHSVSLNPNDQSALSTQVETLRLLRRYPPAAELAARYLGLFPASRLQQESLAKIQYALTGDKAAYLRARAALPLALDDPDGLGERYLLAVAAGELVAAGRVLADPRLQAIANDNGAISDPVSLHRAGIALLQGDAVAAKRHALEAINAYQTTRWTPRQEPLVRLGVARAQALADPTEENVRRIKTRLQELAQRDKFMGITSMGEAAETLTAIGRREEALAVLRELLTGPSLDSPQELRNNPYFASLKADPRFEEILRSAQPL